MRIGLHKNMSNEEYHKPIGLSNSGIRKILDCPAKYYYEYLSGKYEKESTPATLLGELVHALVLEKKEVYNRYIPKIKDEINIGKMPLLKEVGREEFNRCKTLYTQASLARKQEKEKFKLESKGKKIVPDSIWQKAHEMASILEKSKYGAILKGENVEHSIFWEMDDILLKCRPDIYHIDKKLIVDLKTTDSVNPPDFIRSIWKYGYHSQAALNIDGLQQELNEKFTFIIVAIEVHPPYIVQSFNFLPETIAKGREEYYKGAYIYKECKEWNLWPGYNNEIIDIQLPEYLLKREL